MCGLDEIIEHQKLSVSLLEELHNVVSKLHDIGMDVTYKIDDKVFSQKENALWNKKN